MAQPLQTTPLSSTPAAAASTDFVEKTALERYVGSRDYTSHAVATGHIGMYVSRAAREEIPARIISWLRERG